VNVYSKIFMLSLTVLSNCMNTLDDIPQGESWATRFRVTTFVRDGVPVRASLLQPGQAHPGVPQVYEGLGIIRTRDTASQMLLVIDSEHHLEFRVSYADCWAWEPIEWIENE